MCNCKVSVEDLLADRLEEEDTFSRGWELRIICDICDERCKKERVINYKHYESFSYIRNCKQCHKCICDECDKFLEEVNELKKQIHILLDYEDSLECISLLFD